MGGGLYDDGLAKLDRARKGNNVLVLITYEWCVFTGPKYFLSFSRPHLAVFHMLNGDSMELAAASRCFSILWYSGRTNKMVRTLLFDICNVTSINSWNCGQ